MTFSPPDFDGQTRMGKKRVKVTLFVDSLAGGGAQRQVVETARHLDKTHFDVSVVIYHNIRELASELVTANVPIVLISKRAKVDPLFFFRLWRLLHSTRPSILHSYLKTPNLWARLAGRLAGVPCVITSERNVDLAHSRWWILAERLLYRLSSHIIANAIAIQDMLVDTVGVDRERISVIFNGVDTHKFRPVNNERSALLRSALGLDPDEFVIIVPGRVMRQKNQGCAIRALGRLPLADRAGVRLLCVGSLLDRVYLAELHSLVQDFGLQKQVRFLGRRDDMPSVYGLSDVCVLPSLWEGFPNALLEAMACGRPVIASDVADNRRLVDHGETGFLFRSEDDAALSLYLRDAMRGGQDRLRALGTEGRRRMERYYSIETLIRSTVEVYRRFAPSD